MTDAVRVGKVLTDLMQAGHTTALEQLPGVVAAHAETVGLHDVALFAVDLQQKVMRQLTGRGPDAGEGGTEVAVDGTLPGRAYQNVSIVTEPAPETAAGRCRWWAPVTDGVERLGMMRADTAAEDGQSRDAVRNLASLVALLLLSKRSFSDSYARLVRSRPMNVAAEMQWNLTPPPAFAGHNATVSAALEPAYEVGGDAYDYALTGTNLHLGVFDAMGHDTTAGITANVAVSACRNARRQGASLAESSRMVEKTLNEQFGTSRYITGILADLDLETGRLAWVNRGHHLPVVIRAGGRPDQLACSPAGPMGASLGLPVTVCEDQLEPGDRLLLYTDGITEARGADGKQFGMDRFVDFVMHHHDNGRLPLHETLRRLMHAVLEHHDGRLDDDATVLLAEWAGGRQEELVP